MRGLKTKSMIGCKAVNIWLSPSLFDFD
jgi:hypothetical protein